MLNINELIDSSAIPTVGLVWWWHGLLRHNLTHIHSKWSDAIAVFQLYSPQLGMSGPTARATCPTWRNTRLVIPFGCLGGCASRASPQFLRWAQWRQDASYPVRAGACKDHFVTWLIANNRVHNLHHCLTHGLPLQTGFPGSHSWQHCDPCDYGGPLFLPMIRYRTH